MKKILVKSVVLFSTWLLFTGASHAPSNFSSQGNSSSLTDTDSDGVPDGSDQCPLTPSGVVVDFRGCPLIIPGSSGGMPNPTGDDDGDGVPNSVDLCANTYVGATVNGYGCAVYQSSSTDYDNDGVPDYLDYCPDTPAGVPIDVNGCSLE